MIIGIACEDEGHFDAVTTLVDGTLLERFPWLDGIIESCRTWRGRDESSPWYKYSRRDANDLRPIVLPSGIRIAPHGKIGGRNLEPGVVMWRKVLMLFCDCTPRPDLVLLAHDMDGYKRRKRGMNQARSDFDWPFPIAIAAPEPEVEAWSISGFTPLDDGEEVKLTELRLALSFDPTLQSHRLTSHPNDARTDAKRVLEALCGKDRDRRHQCMTDRERLRERGRLNGAADFLEEIDDVLVPLFGHDRG